MSVGSVSTYNPLSSIFSLQQASSGQISSNLTASNAALPASGDSAQFSQMGQMMGSLAQMQSTDPTQFKEIASKISTDLATQASSATSATQTSILNDLSAKFATAAETGSMSSLEPSGGHHGGHGGKSGRMSGSSRDAMNTVASTIASDLGSVSNASSAIGSNAGSIVTSNAGLIGMGGPQAMFTLMNQLSNLEATNPAQFKQVTQKISDDLATQALDSSDSRTSMKLAEMSAKFSVASQDGNMSSLEPSTSGSMTGAGSWYGSSANSLANSGTTSSASSSTSSYFTQNSNSEDAQLSSLQMSQALNAQIQQLMASNLSTYTASSANTGLNL
jgi:hypothetical protein